MNFRTKLLQILTCIFEEDKEFTLSKVYQIAEGPMSYYYPNSNSIRPSIRRNLQQLRNARLINFVPNKRGTYTF